MSAVAAMARVAVGAGSGGSAAAETVLGPRAGRFVCDGPVLARWAITAPPGARALYARAVFLPRMAAGAMRARALADAGLIRLHVTPASPFRAERLFRYWAIRSNLAVAAMPPAAPPAGHLPASERALIEVIEQVADAGAPCPSNAALALASGLSGASRVSHLLAALSARGCVRVEAMAAAPWRVVTVVATGARTGVL